MLFFSSYIDCIRNVLRYLPTRRSSDLLTADPVHSSERMHGLERRLREICLVNHVHELLKPVTGRFPVGRGSLRPEDRKSTRLNSSHSQSSYAVFCFKKK